MRDFVSGSPNYQLATRGVREQFVVFEHRPAKRRNPVFMPQTDTWVISYMNNSHVLITEAL